jgi:hypothetical protein
MRRTSHKGVLVCALALGLAFVPPAARADILAGTDYLTTTSAEYDFGDSIGTVDLQSNPIGPGNTDTIIQRQSDAVINGPSVPFLMTALSLESTAPVNIGGSFFDVFFTLDPSNLANDTGTLSIMGSPSGGTISSTLDVFFEIQFTPLAPGPAPSPMFGEATLTGTGTWTSAPPPGSVDPSDDFFPLLDQTTALFHHSVEPAVIAPEPCAWIYWIGAALTAPLYIPLRRRRGA